MLQHIIQFSIRHRFLIVMIVAFIAAVGIWSAQRLPIDAVPDITPNQVVVHTTFAAMSPIEIEKQITFPIETGLAGIPGLLYTRSISRNGFSEIQAVFEEHVDLYFARQQVNERLSALRDDLPPGTEPRMAGLYTGLSEVYMWIVEFEHPDGKGAAIDEGKPGWQPDGSYLTPEGEVLKTDLERSAYLRTVQDWIIRPQIKTVKDVADTDVQGGYVKQYHIQPDPMKLVSYGLTFHDVTSAVERNNSSAGAGVIEHKGESYLVRVSGRIDRIDQIGSIVLATRNGTPIYIRDVANVGIGQELRTGTASEGGRDVVLGAAMMLVGANSRTVAAAAEAKMDQISLPPGIRARTVLSRTHLVDSTIHTVLKNLAEGAILVIVVLFLLLGNFRAAFITALAIPLSMLITATGMLNLKISGNLMSLGAIDFGLIVDGAVIIVENCLRRLGEKQRELGRPLNLSERLEVVFAASQQVRSATAFGEAIILIVYIPILTLSGVEGKMFRPMALTVMLALVGAFVLSLTFVPAMVAILIRGRVREEENILIRAAKRVYAPILHWAIRLRIVLVILAAAAFAASIFLFTTLGQEFIPTLDEGDMVVFVTRIPSIGLEESSRMQRAIEKKIKDFPEVAIVYSKTGTGDTASDAMPASESDTFVIMKPRSQWPKPNESKEAVRKRIEEALEDLPGNAYEYTQPIQDRFNEMIAGVRTDVAIEIFGDDFEQTVPIAQSISKILATVPGAADIKIEQTEGLPLLSIDVDRNAIARHQLSISDVEEVVDIAVGGRQCGVVFEGDRRFPIIVRLPDQMRGNFSSLPNLPVPLSRADAPDSRPGFVPLSSVAKITSSQGPIEVARRNGKRLVVVQCNVRGRDISSFVNEAQKHVDREIKPRLIAGNFIEWGGQFDTLIAARRRLEVVLPVCFFLIFAMLYSTFHSIRHSLIVFSGVPFALCGGIVALALRGMPFSISAAVGFIALSGVAVLNGLVMVTFINQLRNQGEVLEDAIIHGSLTRLRPVLMTALVASLGFVPMALATGSGAEVQKPLATVVIGGIISSTFLTLILLPALYRLVHRKERPVIDLKRET